VKFKLKYGEGYKTLHIPYQADVSILKPCSLPVLPDIGRALEMALDNPVQASRLEDKTTPLTVAIAIPDQSRPTPSRELLPVLLRRLYDSYPNLKSEQVVIVIGGGLHPPMDEEAVKKFLPPDKTPGCLRVIHAPHSSRLVDYGHTRRGTPVAINAEYAQADLKLLIGQIDPHQFVGFTGGAKGVVVGCASPTTIEHNHGLMFEDGAEIGRLQGNPVREDLNEAGRMVGVDLAINVVLNPSDHVVGLWAGEPVAVLKEGAKTCAHVYGVPISIKFDMAVVSCGGYPKDICLYQAQKGLNLASQAVKPGGKILLLAECLQGVGDDIYYEYVCQFDTAEAAMADFKSRGFKMGAHKSYLFGKTLTNCEVVIDSDIPQDVLHNCHLTAGHAQDILNRWLAEFPERPKVAVVPNANTTYFFHA